MYFQIMNLQLLASAGIIAVVGLLDSPYAADISCGAAGLFGGTTMQLLTYVERKPHWTVILGNMLASIVLGWGVYAYFGVGPGELRGVLLKSVAAGATGAWGFRLFIKKWAPGYLETEPEDGHGDK